MHRQRILTWWYALMIAGGFLFGLLGDRRPFGQDMLAHPLIVFFAIAAAALLVLRIALTRPVPELIPERPLIAGCLLGAGAFLAGNFIATRVLLAA
jgi:cytochrome b561